MRSSQWEVLIENDICSYFFVHMSFPRIYSLYYIYCAVPQKPDFFCINVYVSKHKNFIIFTLRLLVKVIFWTESDINCSWLWLLNIVSVPKEQIFKTKQNKTEYEEAKRTSTIASPRTQKHFNIIFVSSEMIIDVILAISLTSHNPIVSYKRSISKFHCNVWY